MKLKKKQIDIFLVSWMKWDAELWGQLRDIQLKFLLERIVYEMSFKEMATKHGISVQKMREMFSVVLFKIGRSHGKKFSSLLRQINTELEAIEMGLKKKDSTDLLYKNIYLN